MAAFAILGTNHTGLTVSSLDRALDFYCGVLGFELINRAGRDPAIIQEITGIPGADIEAAYVKAPGLTLELIEYRGPADRGKMQGRSCDTGHPHVAFNVDNVDAVLAAVRAGGGVTWHEPVIGTAGPNKGARVIYTHDPDGITLEFIQPPPR